MPSILLPLDSQIQVDISAVDGSGANSIVENLRLASSDPAVVRVDIVDVDSFILFPLAVGSVQITATADALIGDGEEMITKFITIDVVAGKATDLRFSVGDPTPKPSVPPPPQ